MFLQKLEIQGFKSFVDRTHVEFGDGITGVVGPNGCGKTNVSDAIRWVLGEQSAKQLRGDSMEDVIFNGCPTRKPVGLAEVHITFRNDRGILPTEFSEVTVSRRVYRSGVSEYFLNKAPCRLKDIRDLLFDTGMGSHAYSVIERSMVDHVLSDNSGHRRFLFEEASGITKYKARKKETLTKLDATETDLTRINDIVFELERELRSLARQVGKARRFQRLRDSIRDLDLTLTSSRVLELTRGEAAALERWQDESTRREGVAARLATLEAALNDRKLVLLELERELATAVGGLRDREETRQQAEHQIVLLEERAAGHARRAGEARAEIERMRERLAETLLEEQQAEALRAEQRRDTETTRAELAEREQTLAACESELRTSRNEAAQHKQLSLDLFSTEAEKRGAAERVLERLRQLAERHAGAAAHRDELSRRAAERAETAAAAATRRDGLEAELAGARAALTAVEQRLESLETAIAAAEASLATTRQGAAAAESRLQVLLELKRNFEGVSDGVKSLFHDDAHRTPELIGVLADVLDIPAAQLDAIEAALGEAAAFVLVRGHDALRSGRDRLLALGAGRATILDVAAAAPRRLPDLPAEAGVRGRASDAVRCEAGYRPLVERLLGNVVLVDDAATAERLADVHEGLRFVSPEGEVWDRGRVRAGVSGAGGLLHREMEIRDLNGQLAELGLALEALVRERDDRVAARQAALAERTEAAAAVDARREAVETVVREQEAADRERAWALAEAEERGRELEVLDAETESLQRARAQAEADLLAFQQELERARRELSDLDAVVHAVETRREETAARVQTLRDRLFELGRGQLESETRFARAEQTRRELESGLEARDVEARQCDTAREEILAEVSGLRAGLAGLVDSEAVQRERVQDLQGRFGEAKEAAATGEEEARELRFEHTELSELLHQIELDRVQQRAERDRTYERLKTEYGLDVEAWTPAEPPAEFDHAAGEQELEEQRQRLRTLGTVNLLALEEYGKKKERWQFLTQQRADLLQARTQLLEAIEKINVTASQLFVQTFDQVQTHFRDIFTTLFEGGDAELRAIGEDPLECEIEIVAKPRGKHLQSISLMSGGERALTAIALLFAIYLVKPSPFCLLDEVDAPLDDANVERFIRMLRRFSGRTQFVVITHNKKTMESAGSLYGVTMQELGVSKLVSVRFDRRGADAPADSAAAGPAQALIPAPRAEAAPARATAAKAERADAPEPSADLEAAASASENGDAPASENGEAPAPASATTLEEVGA